MRAVTITEHGGVDRLRVSDLPRPHPAPGEVLVAVEAADVGAWDAKVREGDAVMLAGVTYPLVLGWSLAGTVAALGEDVQDLAVGDAVFGMGVHLGGWADYATAPAATLARIPEGVGWLAAAALAVSGTAAHQGLHDALEVRSGETVLVAGGAGATGMLAVQLAARAGMRVLATASPANAALVRGLGAEQVYDYAVDYAAQVRADHPGGVDAVLDTVDGVVSATALRPGGRYAHAASPPPEVTTMLPSGVNLVPVYGAPDRTRLTELADLLATGRLVLPVLAALPLERAAQAQELAAAKPTPGKIVLAIGDAASREAVDLPRTGNQR